VIVIDMQNAYASPGGYLDLAGFDISGAAKVIDKIKGVLDVARGAGMPVIYFQNGWDPTMSRPAARARPTGTSPTP
jgi:ureidoacrylate peracid hydrolase